MFKLNNSKIKVKKVNIDANLVKIGLIKNTLKLKLN